MHLILDNVGHTFYQLLDELNKSATHRQLVDMEVSATRRLSGRKFSKSQDKWSTSEKGKVTCRFFPSIRTYRLQRTGT